jgi:hypothetical protein
LSGPEILEVITFLPQDNALAGGLGKRVYLVCSKNKTWVQQHEEDNEKIVAWGQIIIKADCEDVAQYEKGISEGQEMRHSTASVDAAIDKVLGDAKGAGTKYSKIFDTPATLRLLIRMLQMSTHFRPTKYIKVNIIGSWTGTWSGVSGHFSKV